MYSARAAISCLGRLAVFGTIAAACANVETSDGGADGDADLDRDGPCDTDPDRFIAPDAGDGDVDVEGIDEPPPVCENLLCDLWPQCGCIAGQACVHDDSGERSCKDAGTVRHGGVCVEDELDCMPGTVCAGYVDEPAYCLQYCRDDEDCAGLGESSVCELRFLDDAEQVIARACSLSCDPASNSPACAEGIQCVIVIREDSGELFTHCMGMAGSGMAGMPCDSASGSVDCQPGHFCANVGFGDQCIRRCTFPDGPECAGLELCRAFYVPAIIGDIEYGYCL
jgi:hypothetical protein